MGQNPRTCAILLLALLTFAAICSGDKGCPGNEAECQASCGGPGRGKCERRWYSWRLQWRCKCNPCQGTLVLGACITSIGISCNGENCRPTGSFRGLVVEEAGSEPVDLTLTTYLPPPTPSSLP